MDNVKYTREGQKVVVIGDLNQNDKIVQEIFVTQNGDEIPSGERFIARNLLDEPSKSWKEIKLEELENSYDLRRKQWEERIEDLEKEKNSCYKSLKLKVNWLKNVAKQPLESQIKEIINNISIFLSDTDKFIFKEGYDWGIYKFDKEITHYLDRDIEFRLLSLYGSSDGNINWKINTWGDGSGSNTNGLHFFDDYNKAKIFAQNYLNSREEYRSYDIETAKKIGLLLDNEKLNKKNEEIRELTLKDIKSAEDEICVLKKRLIGLNEEYNGSNS